VGIGEANPLQRLVVSNGNLLLSNTNNTAGRLMLAEASANGTQTTSFQAPTSLAADIQYVLPTTAPALVGSLLQTTSISGTTVQLGWTTQVMATRSIWMAGGSPNTDPLADLAWVRVTNTGVNGEIIINNTGTNTIKYSYSLDFATPIAANLTAGSSFTITGLSCASSIDIRVSQYSNITDTKHFTFMGMGMCNGHIRGQVFYDL
jgi:hypothetical protein